MGGILVGQDLIRAAEVRAFVSKFDKFNAAVNAFRLKFNCLPDDCNDADAEGIGGYYAKLTSVATRSEDNGDGNGMIGDGDITAGASDNCTPTRHRIPSPSASIFGIVR